ncbi:hypothetical protein TNCV_447791 [Trichonephila clavipes]|nr:hypothetical protein TNCV_447791 [Trichonephila clavipes]
MTRRRVENRDGSLGYPRFVRSVFTKESKPLGKKKKITRVLRDCDTRTLHYTSPLERETSPPLPSSKSFAGGCLNMYISSKYAYALEALRSNIQEKVRHNITILTQLLSCSYRDI